MKTLRFVLPLLALAGLLSSGCVLVSAQVLASYDLPSPLPVAGAATIVGVDVDLNTVPEYADHKDKLKDIIDLAFLGKFQNLGGAVSVELWMTPAFTSYTDVSGVVADPTAVRVWGPFDLSAGPSNRAITWAQSAALFNPAGRTALVQEIKGDGQFTLYAVGASGTYSFVVHNGALAVLLDAAN